MGTKWGHKDKQAEIKVIIMVYVSFVFDHRARTPRDMEGPIEARINANNVVRYCFTGVKVKRNNWESGTVVDRHDSFELNERLRIIKRLIEREVNRCLELGIAFDMKKLKHSISSVDAPQFYGFLEWVADTIPTLPNSEDRKKHYVTLVSRLMEFGNLRSWDDVKVETIYRFDSWLHGLRMANGKQLDQSTIYNYHKNLKAIINVAVKFDKIERNPYDRMKGEFSRGEKENIEFLSEEEMKRIEQLVLLPGELATARDLFVFQMYTGLSYSDTQNFVIDNYKLDKGKWKYVGERIKTGVAFVSQLLPPVIEVLKRHGWRVPRMALQHYNESLKLLGKAAGIATRMHSHLARHTFATYMLRNGVKVENLQKMLGHKRITQTLRYSKVLAESVHADYDKIFDKLK